MRMKFTLATLALAMTLIWVIIARDNSNKTGHLLSNLNGSCKSRWVLKKDGILGLCLKTTNIMVQYLIIRDGWNLREDTLESIYIASNTTRLFESCKLILGMM